MLESYHDILEVKDLCSILHIGRKTAYQLLKNGELPYRKIGRHYKIRKDAVVMYMSQNS